MKERTVNRKITMANLKNREAKVTSKKAVVKQLTEPVFKYRGVSYKPSDIKKTAPTTKRGIYRGSAWEA